jgi:hypothetical protein
VHGASCFPFSRLRLRCGSLLLLLRSIRCVGSNNAVQSHARSRVASVFELLIGMRVAIGCSQAGVAHPPLLQTRRCGVLCAAMSASECRNTWRRLQGQAPAGGI